MMSQLKYPHPQVFTDAGWEYEGPCACKVNLKYYYKHPKLKGYKLEWWINSYQFCIKYKEHTTVQILTPMRKAEDVLKNKKWIL